VPEAGAPCNGCTVTVGDRFVLDLMVDPASFAVTAQQAYFTFSYQQLQNVRVDQIGTSCVLTGTVTPDSTIFDAVLQNEVCNGPAPCNFRGNIVPPGSAAFASGALNNPPYSGPPFRVARIGFCAVAPGTAVLHWEFSPPSPPTRDTQIVDENSNVVSNPACYVDYIIHVVAATPTATSVPRQPTDTPEPPPPAPTETATAAATAAAASPTSTSVPPPPGGASPIPTNTPQVAGATATSAATVGAAIPPAAATATPITGVLPAEGPGAQPPAAPPAAPPEVLPTTGIDRSGGFGALALLMALSLSAVGVVTGLYLKRRRLNL
jgi:hypothetical protein